MTWSHSLIVIQRTWDVLDRHEGWLLIDYKYLDPSLNLSTLIASTKLQYSNICPPMWKKSLRYKKMRQIDQSLPLDKFLEITSSLNHRQTSVLTQLRTGHILINKHLHRIGKSDMPYCPQFTCPRYAQERHQLVTKLPLLPFFSLFSLSISYDNAFLCYHVTFCP